MGTEFMEALTLGFGTMLGILLAWVVVGVPVALFVYYLRGGFR